MKEKAKSVFLSVIEAIELFFKYLFSIIAPSIEIIGVSVLCSFAVFGFYDTAAPLAMKGLYHIAIISFYVLMVIVSVVNAVVVTYKTGKKQLISPKNKAEKFRYFNGFLIGVLSAAPFIIMCLVANSKGFTYYKSDEAIELTKLFLYVYAFRFSEYPTAADFAYTEYMLLALVPIIACTLSYIAPRIVLGIKSGKKKKEEAV